MTSPDFSLIDLPGFLGENTVSQVYTDGSPLPLLLDAITRTQTLAGQRQDPNARFWSSVARPQDSVLREVIEFDINSDKIINRLQFDLARFPQETHVERYDPDSPARWVPLRDETGSPVVIRIAESNPPVLPTLVAPQNTNHPQHFGANHWEHYDLRLMQVRCARIRLVLGRGPGVGPTNQLGEPVDYSLGVRGFNVGYRVETKADIPSTPLGGPIQGEHVPFASSLDILGSTVTYSLRERNADQLAHGGVWKCEPQPVNYAVVNLYLDVQSGGDPQIIDRFFIDPLVSGCAVNIYFTNDDDWYGNPTQDPAMGRFEGCRWTSIDRDFKLRRGFYHFNPTKARYFKFEFSNLAPTPYESTTTSIRRVRMFPDAVDLRTSQIEQSGNEGGAGLVTLSQLDPLLRFSDNDRPSQTTYANDSRGYTPTEVFHTTDPIAAARLRNLSPLYNFQSWHSTPEIPRFHGTQVHHYAEVDVVHDQRVAYEVGIKNIEVFRLDYTADDDTDQYLDLFHDEQNLASLGGWTIDRPGDLRSPEEGAGPWTVTSLVYHSRSPVRGIQYATTQTPNLQLLPDDDFNYGAQGQDKLDLAWKGVGDCMGPTPSNAYNTDIGTTVEVRRPVVGASATDPFPHTYRGIERKYHTWRNIERLGITYGDLNNPTGTEVPFGGIANKQQIVPAPGSRLYAAARVISPQALVEPLVMQIFDVLSNTVLAEAEAFVPANQVVEWYVSYTAADGGLDTGKTYYNHESEKYADLERHTWRELEQSEPPKPVLLEVRLIQRGQSSGPWYTDTLSLYEESIRWEFSRDGGTTFYPAFLIRNDAHGVFTFPEKGVFAPLNTWDDIEQRYDGVKEDPSGPTWDDLASMTYSDLEGLAPEQTEPENRALVWRATTSRPRQHINGLSIRPWYGGPLGNQGIPAREGVQAQGPNVALYDHYQPIDFDPRYRVWHKPVPQEWWFFYRQFLLLRHDSDPKVIITGAGYYLPETLIDANGTGGSGPVPDPPPPPPDPTPDPPPGGGSGGPDPALYYTDPTAAQPGCQGRAFPWQYGDYPFGPQGRSFVTSPDLGKPLGNTFTRTWVSGDFSDQPGRSGGYMYSGLVLHFRRPSDGCIRYWYAGNGYTFTTGFTNGPYSVNVPFTIPDSGGDTVEPGDIFVGWEVLNSGLTSTGSGTGLIAVGRGYQDPRSTT